MIKYNHEHGSNFNANLHFSLEKKWNELSQLSQKILRWYDSLVYYQFTKYNNDKKGIFNTTTLEKEIFLFYLSAIIILTIQNTKDLSEGILYFLVI